MTSTGPGVSDATADRSATSDDLLEVRNLVTAFDTDAGRVNAVDGVSFKVARGKTVGFLRGLEQVARADRSAMV